MLLVDAYLSYCLSNVENTAAYRVCPIGRYMHRLPLHQQLGIPGNNTANKVPIAMGPNPVRNDDASGRIPHAQAPGPLSVLAVPQAEILHDGRVHPRGDVLGPAARVEEVARGQEVDEERPGRGRRDGQP